MIERGHLLALQAASANAESAFKDGDIEAVSIASRQIQAIAKLEQARKSIFQELDVPDIIAGVPMATVDIQVPMPEEIADLSFGKTLRHIRERALVSGAQLAARALMSQAMLSNLEHDKWSGNKRRGEGGKGTARWTFTGICQGLELTPDDAETKILANKYLGQYPKLISEVRQFFAPKPSAPKG